MFNTRVRTVSLIEEDLSLNYDPYSSSPRSGKWTEEEEIFANKLIQQFQEGSLTDCGEGSTLRAYLSKRLNCAPMRISKKFSGLCIGKLTFTKKTNFDSNGLSISMNSCSSPDTIVESVYPTDLDSHNTDLHTSLSFDTFTEFHDIHHDENLFKIVPPQSASYVYEKPTLKRLYEDTFSYSTFALYNKNTKRRIDNESKNEFIPETKCFTPTCCACGRKYIYITPGSPSPTSLWSNSDDSNTTDSSYLSPTPTPPPPSYNEGKQQYQEDRDTSTSIATYYSDATPQPWPLQFYSLGPFPAPITAARVRTEASTASPFQAPITAARVRTEAEDWLEVLEFLCDPTTLPIQSLLYTTTPYSATSTISSDTTGHYYESKEDTLPSEIVRTASFSTLHTITM